MSRSFDMLDHEPLSLDDCRGIAGPDAFAEIDARLTASVLLECLNDRERHVVDAHCRDASYRQIANEMGPISQERVRQIERKAIRKMRRHAHVIGLYRQESPPRAVVDPRVFIRPSAAAWGCRQRVAAIRALLNENHRWGLIVIGFNSDTGTTTLEAAPIAEMIEETLRLRILREARERAGVPLR